MHYADLSSCDYGSLLQHESWKVPILAVGWLERFRRYRKGVVEDEIVERAELFREQTSENFSGFIFRGLHGCSLCLGGSSRSGIKDSHVNLLIPGEDCVYVASGGLVHYMTKHSYRPPDEFIEALKSCPLPDTEEYKLNLIKSNRGVRPSCLWTDDELFPELAKLRRSEQAVPPKSDRAGG